MINLLNNQDKQKLRYERKFVLPHTDCDLALKIIRLSKGCFKEAYPTRCVNNIYLDTLNRKCFESNIRGDASRFKVRIRWYGDDVEQIKNPVLEIKAKEGLSGYKIVFPLTDFKFKECADQKFLPNLIACCDINDYIKEELRGYEVALLNRYQRHYHESFDRHFRLTLDFDLEYSVLIKGVKKGFLSNNARNHVLELKYAPHNDREANQMTQNFPFRLARHSKYVNGILETMILT